MEIRMIAPTIWPRVDMNIRSASPRRLSMVSISLENRFMIRPKGWVDTVGQQTAKVKTWMIYRSIKEWHGCVHDPRNRVLMQCSRREIRQKRKDRTHNEESHRLSNAKACIYNHLRGHGWVWEVRGLGNDIHKMLGSEAISSLANIQANTMTWRR